MKNTILAAVTMLLITGCAMTPQTDGLGNSFVGYKDVKVVTEEEAKNLPRDQRSERITKDMEQVGFKQLQVSTGIDAISLSISSVYKNQYQLMQKYQTIVDNHRDVTSFIQANEGKSKDELSKEIKKFDSMAQAPSEKIGPKIQKYRVANQEIQAENLKLAGELAVQAAKLSTFFKDNSDTLLGMEGVAILLNAGKLSDAYDLAKIRIHLSTIANDFISDEKAVLEVTKKIQSVLDTKL